MHIFLPTRSHNKDKYFTVTQENIQWTTTPLEQIFHLPIKAISPMNKSQFIGKLNILSRGVVAFDFRNPHLSHRGILMPGQGDLAVWGFINVAYLL